MAASTIHYSGPIVTRAEAKRLGLKRYFPATACKKAGHIAERYLDGACIECKNPTRSPTVITGIFYQGPIVTWKDANALGLMHYFNGPDKPCKNGHIAERLTSAYGCLECYRLNAARIYDENRDEINATRRSPDSRKKNRATKQAWFNAHPGKQSEYNRQKKARRKGAGGRFTAEDEAKLRARQKHCHICGKRFTKADPATIDHVIALADGGRHDPSNIALAHLSCNCSKQDRRTHLI